MTSGSGLDRPRGVNRRMRHPATLPPVELLRSCRETRTRRSGPGGQHRNKVETAIVLLHEPTGVTAEANEKRSQGANRTVAQFRLRINLALDVREESASPGDVSVLWSGRIRGGRISVNPTHDDFPSLLSEALDVLAALDWDTGRAAEGLGISMSQLVRFLKLEPRAFRLLNTERQSRKLRSLK